MVSTTSHHCTISTIGVNSGVGSGDPPDFGIGGRGRLQGGRGQVVQYYYSLSCRGRMFESGDFSRDIEKFAQNVAVG